MCFSAVMDRISAVWHVHWKGLMPNTFLLLQILFSFGDDYDKISVLMVKNCFTGTEVNYITR